MEKIKIKKLICRKRIARRIRQLGRLITASYNDDKPILCICVLRGAAMFFCDLIRRINKEIVIDFITLSSYENSTLSSGAIKLITDINEKLTGRHVLIIDDIIESGLTLNYLLKHFSNQGALDIKAVCLLDKPKNRKFNLEADFTAFTLKSDAFVVGYGLDYAQLYRNLDGIYEVVS